MASFRGRYHRLGLCLCQDIQYASHALHVAFPSQSSQIVLGIGLP